VNHVQPAIPADGEDRGRAYWVGLLGLAELPKPPVLAARGGCWFDAAAFQVHLGVEQDFRPARKAHPAFEVRGVRVRALAERLAAGYKVVWSDEVPGQDHVLPKRCHTADPFGNRLEFLEPH